MQIRFNASDFMLEHVSLMRYFRWSTFYLIGVIQLCFITQGYLFPSINTLIIIIK